MVKDGVFGSSSVDAFPDFRQEVGNKLLSKRVGPSGDAGRGGGVQGGDKGEKGLEDVCWCVV